MKKILIALIKFYRKNLSPLKRYNSCKFIPTCSEYALQAVGKYGALKGSRLAVKRICKCNPLSKGGFDPLP